MGNNDLRGRVIEAILGMGIKDFLGIAGGLYDLGEDDPYGLEEAFGDLAGREGGLGGGTVRDLLYGDANVTGGEKWVKYANDALTSFLDDKLGDMATALKVAA